MKIASEKSTLPLLMPDHGKPSSPSLTRKKYTPAFKAECGSQVAAGARQTDAARAQGLSPLLREARGYSQQLADLANVAQSTSKRIELRQLAPTLDLLISLSRALALEVRELVDDPALTQADAQITSRPGAAPAASEPPLP